MYLIIYLTQSIIDLNYVLIANAILYYYWKQFAVCLWLYVQCTRGVVNEPILNYYYLIFNMQTQIYQSPHRKSPRVHVLIGTGVTVFNEEITPLHVHKAHYIKSTL